MRRIKLTQGKVALVDDTDYALVSQHKWCAHKNRYKIYASTNVKVGNKWTTLKMHGLIMGTPKGMETDHRNGNGLDNRRKNLRVVTNSGNHCSFRKSVRPKKSKYRGVFLDSKSQKWRAQINFKQTIIYLGTFSVGRDAALARDKKAIKLGFFPEALNFPHLHPDYRKAA